LSDGEGYAAKFYPAWEDFPTGDIDADTRRMNEFIEARVREMPEQYYWVHKRFKTARPAKPGFTEHEVASALSRVSSRRRPSPAPLPGGEGRYLELRS
jgi:hypothetical protein